MSLVLTTAAFAVVYAILQYGILKPAKKKGWPASDGAAVAKAGMLAALSTAVSFVQLAMIVYACAAIVFGLLSWVSPELSAATLATTHSFLLGLKGWTDVIGDFAGGFVLWLALAAVVYFIWRARRSEFRDVLRDEYRKQIDEFAEQLHRGEQLPPLAPTAQMTALAKHIRSIEQAMAGAPESANLAEVRQQLGGMGHDLILLDLIRRVDLTKVPIDDNSARGWWPRIRLTFLSKGMQDTTTWLTKWLGRTGQVAALVLVLGVSAPVLGALVVAPVLNSITELAILAQEADAQKSLQALAEAAKDKADETAIPASTYQALARQFLSSVAHSSVWQGEAHKSDPKAHGQAASDVDSYARRDAILHDYAAAKFDVGPSDVAPTPTDFNAPEDASGPSSPAGPDAGAPSNGGNGRYTAYRDKLDTGATTIDEAAVNRCAEWFRAASRTSRRAHDAILAWGRSFQRPAEAWDYFSEPLGELTSHAAEFAIADPKNFLGKNLRKVPRKTIDAAVERFVKVKLNALLQAMMSRGDIDTALGDIRFVRDAENHFVLDPQEYDQLRQDAALRESDARQLASMQRPGLEPTLSDLDMLMTQGLVDTLRPLSSLSDTPEAARDLFEEAAGSYDDIFPPDRASLNHTPLGRNLPTPDQMAMAEAADAVERARDYERVNIFHKNGGVVIGRPMELSANAPPRDLTWSIHGQTLDLTLIDHNGRAISLGNYRGQLVAQALAFAADGRQTVATILNSDVAQLQRIFVHPVFTNTPLGNEMIAIDHFVFDGVKDPLFEAAELQAEEQLDLYKEAYDIATTTTTPQQWAFDNQNHISLMNLEAPKNTSGAGTPNKIPSEVIGEVFPAGWRVDDVRQSLFSAYPNRFDFDLVRTMQSCATTSGASDAAFWKCVGAYRVDTDIYTAQNGSLVSGVRDIPINAASVRRAKEARGTLPPLHFLMQTVFPEIRGTVEVISDTALSERPSAVTERPWQFPQLGSRIEDGTVLYARSTPIREAILEDVRSFALLQAVFRSLLDDDELPRLRLLQLMRAAREIDSIQKRPTPIWSSFATATADKTRTLKDIDALRQDLLVRYKKDREDPRHADSRESIGRCTAFLSEEPAEAVFGVGLSKACPMSNRALALLATEQAHLAFVSKVLSDPRTDDFDDKNENVNHAL